VRDRVPGFAKFVMRPLYGVVLRFLGVFLLLVGLVAAALDARWAGFTPVVWLLLALAALLGANCNMLAQVLQTSVSRCADPPDRWNDLDSMRGSDAAPPGNRPLEPSWFDVEIYCVKCRGRRTIRNPQTVRLANGRPAYRGICPECGTKVTRILKPR